MRFSPRRFKQCASELSRAVYDLRDEVKNREVEDRYGVRYYTLGTDMSAIDRIKSKALLAKSVVPAAIADVEADLDWIIGQREVIKRKKDEATAPHKEAISGVVSELEGLKGALDILSNGGPLLDPLSESGPVAHDSVTDTNLPSENVVDIVMQPTTAPFISTHVDDTGAVNRPTLSV